MVLSELTYFSEDVGRTAELYETVFGTEPAVRDEGIALFELGDITVMIHEASESEAGRPPNEDHPAVTVEDLDGRFAALVDAGFDVVAKPREYRWGRAAYVRDPDGRLVELAADAEA
jgi:catechol 2,3-dioxygenase-like lactoylglutathione lyase family enzyme